MSGSKLKGSKKARLSMARLAAVQCVYQWLQSGTKSTDLVSYYQTYYTGLREEDAEMLPPDLELLTEVLEGVQTRFSELKSVLSSHLINKTQEIDSKKDMLVLAILYCGSYELLVARKYDPPLIISEYLNVTNAFYDTPQVKLINAILDSLKNAA